MHKYVNLNLKYQWNRKSRFKETSLTRTRISTACDYHCFLVIQGEKLTVLCTISPANPSISSSLLVEPLFNWALPADIEITLIVVVAAIDAYMQLIIIDTIFSRRERVIGSSIGREKTCHTIFTSLATNWRLKVKTLAINSTHSNNKKHFPHAWLVSPKTTSTICQFHNHRDPLSPS